MLIINDSILKKTPLIGGGESLIYEYNDLLLKVYKDHINKKDKIKRLELLMNITLPNNVIRPIELAYNSKKEFIGFTMNKVQGETFKLLSDKKSIKARNITIKDILKMLVDIKNTLSQLHKNNIFISDLNDLNILFDDNFNIYFIDVDSYSIDDMNGTAYTESFLDPLLVAHQFSEKSDAYAFAVLAFKTLTKVHPFGGTTDPDINLLNRMKQKITVFNKSVTIPRVIPKWDFIYPKFLEEIKQIFEMDKRFLLDKSLDDFFKNLKLCKKHNDYYYSKFTDCPVCHNDAVIITHPIKAQDINAIPYVSYFRNSDIKLMLSANSYIDINNDVRHKDSAVKIKFSNNKDVYFSDNGNIAFVSNEKEFYAIIKNEKYKFDKKYKTNVIVKDNLVYYADMNNQILELSIHDKGNSIKNIAKISLESIFNVYDKDNYFICNTYHDTRIVNINGYNYTFKDNSKILNYGIHFDKATRRWLFVFEDKKGIFKTLIFDKNRIVYESETIRYMNDLTNICFDNNIIFKSNDKVIRGFSFEQNVYKDFKCEVINEDTKLIREKNKFVAINEKEVYIIG